MEFLDRMHRVLPPSLLQLLQERPSSGGGHARAPRLEVHMSARSKRLPQVAPQPAAMPLDAILAPLVFPPSTTSRDLAPSPQASARSDAAKAVEREVALEEHINKLE